MNIKRILMSGGAAMLCIGSALAVPARPGVRNVTLPDGSSISVRLIGDEFAHTYVTEDGIPVSRGADGYFYYATYDGKTAVKASNPAMRSQAEENFLKQNSSELSLKNYMKKRSTASKLRRVHRAADGTSTNGNTQVPQTGSPNIPVVLVQYKDVKFKDADPNDTFTKFFESGAVSGHQYFVDQSNGKFTPKFDVYGPYTLTGNRATYGGNDYWGNDKGVCTMVAQGCQAADSDVDFSKYDNDGDGECDVVIILYAGDGEASSTDSDAENAVWPCQWALSDTQGDYGRTITLDKTKIDKFAVFNELNGSNLSQIDGVGTFCHEFSHCLGLPDLYDTEYGPHFGMGYWSILDSGCYNDDGYTPLGYSAYEKEFMGWMDIEEGADNTFYTLSPLNSGADRAVKLTNEKDKNEYYIIENRKKQGWDMYMPAEGLLIYHVTYDADAWEANEVNNYDMQRFTPVPADNSLKLDRESYFGETYYYVNEDDLKGDLWPYGDATELTNESRPAATVNTGTYLDKPVTEIVKNADGTISFWCMKGKKPAVGVPGGMNHSKLNATDVTINWLAADSNDVTYTLEVAPHREIAYELVKSSTFTNNNHGWEVEGYGETSAADGIRLGSTKQQGGVISPALKAADGDDTVTIKFRAKSYGNDESSINVALMTKAGSAYKDVDAEEVKLTSSFADYCVVLKGATDNFYIELSTTAKKKRIYIYSAEVYTGDASEAVATRAGGDNAESVRTFTDIAGTSYTVKGLTPNALYDCRVKAVAKDTDNFGDSAWSPVYVLDLSQETTIVVDVADMAADAEYYTLQGLKVAGIPSIPGIYIKRCGGKAAKVLVK